MKNILTRRLGQSILEYALLVIVVSTAFTAMFVYFQRAMNARLEDISQEYTPKAPQ